MGYENIKKTYIYKTKITTEEKISKYVACLKGKYFIHILFHSYIYIYITHICTESQSKIYFIALNTALESQAIQWPFGPLRKGFSFFLFVISEQ